MPLDLNRTLLRQEAERKLFHFAWAIYPLIYYMGYPRDGMLLLILSALAIWSGIEIARSRGYSVLSDEQMREHEKKSVVMGTFFQVLSLFLAVLLFDRPAAILAMLFCCVGDSATGFAGAILISLIGTGKTSIREYGRTVMPLRLKTFVADLLYAVRHRKSYLLMAVMFVTCVVTGFIAYPGAGLAFIAAGAAGAVVADGFAWRMLGLTLNDDLTITLAAGGAITLAMLL
jgi:dolichol kinase